MLATLFALLIGLFVIFLIVGVFDPAWVRRFFGVEEGTGKFRILEFIGVGMGGVVLAIGATIAHRRAVAMERTAKAQAKAADEQAAANRGAEAGRRQERLKNAIEHLGHESDSVRLGGAYELFHLAQDIEDLGQTVMNILCAHIRRTTGEAGYRETYKWKPSEEVESLLNLLFIQEHTVFKGCHIDLRESWLNRAFLRSARLQGALLTRAWLQGAFASKACLQGADLYQTHIQKAELDEAHLQGANLYDAELQGAILVRAQLQGADFHGAQLQGAILVRAQLQGATSEDADKLSFVKRIRQNIGWESDLSKATFAGGLSRENVDSIVKDLPDKKAKELREILEPHVGASKICGLPEDSGAIVGVYTAEEAERWIAEYTEATGEA